MDDYYWQVTGTRIRDMNNGYVDIPEYDYEMTPKGMIKGIIPLFQIKIADPTTEGKTITVLIGAQGIISTITSWLARLGFWTFRVFIKEPGVEVKGVVGRRDTTCTFDFSRPPDSNV